MRSFFAVLAALVCMVALGASPAQAQKRLAFVIGNGGYLNVPKLPNALNDANATRTMLQEAGFEVVPAIDQTLPGLRAALSTFIGKVQQAGRETTAVVYYAGHAVQVDGANLILPIDIRPESAASIPGQSLSLSEILKQLDATGAKAKIAILDACRDNPFVARELVARGLSLQTVDGAADGIRSEAGLARIDSTTGTFVAFATSPGSSAADGAGTNSPFTEAFIRLAREPGLPVEQLFRRIRLAVHDSTNGQQLPWDTSSLISDVSFFTSPAGSTAPGTAAPGTSAASPVSLTTRPTAAVLRSLSPADAYRAAIAWDRPDIYRGFLDARPNDERTLRIFRISNQRNEETAWAETVRAGDAESFKAFARLYPGSAHLNEALRLAARAPSRNQPVRTAAVCPVCPAQTPARTQRANYTPRSPQQPARPATPRQAPAGPTNVAPPVPLPVLPIAEGPRWTRFYVGVQSGGGDQRSQANFSGAGPARTTTTTNTTTNTTTAINEVVTPATPARTVTTTRLVEDTTSPGIFFPVTTTTIIPGTPATVAGVPVTTTTTTTTTTTATQPSSIASRLVPSGVGTLAGGVIGFSLQTGMFVFGAESDLNIVRTGGSGQAAFNPFSDSIAVSTVARSELQFLGTARGRIGVALGDFLFYGTGGYAFGQLQQRGSVLSSPGAYPSYAGSNSSIAGGWTVGGGVEYALTRFISLKLDYLHYDLGTRTLTLNEVSGTGPAQTASLRSRTKGDLVRAGINFGF